MCAVLNDMYVGKNLIIQHLNAVDDQDALSQLSKLLYQEGIVKETYIQAVKAREIEYSTGLQCEDMGVAIPHTDAEHVNVQAIGIGILETPVNFKQMGAPDVDVKVKLIFMLAIKEPHKQMEFLQALMMAFQSKGKLLEMIDCTTQEDVVYTFQTFFTV